MNGSVSGARSEQGSWTWGGCVLTTAVYAEDEDDEVDTSTE
jgi:hypothetical protein